MIVAAVICFVVVTPMNALFSRLRRDADAATPMPSDEARLLAEIRDLLAERGRGQRVLASSSGRSPSRPT